ncbi:thermonuclease family protein [Siminovitchia sediminis]|uniref:Thermonuclease family protein n=1 Tax=Siminovitchia sediminis TaxID=1274353 RepID=A0ABW4KDU5_9BACI
MSAIIVERFRMIFKAIFSGKRFQITIPVLVVSLFTLSGCTDIAPSVDQDEGSETEKLPAENQSATGEKSVEKNTKDTTGTTDLVPVTLVKVIDGDTIKVLYQGQEENVRYLLIDTPETNHPRLGKQPFGEEAKERNKQLLSSGEVALEFDIGERVDKYGRLLAYVYVDGKSVQETLLEEGLARVAYVYPPNTRHLTPFEEAQNKAKAKEAGIWSIENYATDSGFKDSSNHSPDTSGVDSSSHNKAGNSSKTVFQNCTELRKVYPDGVPKGHSAYQDKMDRDKDGYACER